MAQEQHNSHADCNPKADKAYQTVHDLPGLFIFW